MDSKTFRILTYPMILARLVDFCDSPPQRPIENRAGKCRCLVEPSVLK
ncbi:MAG TPA: hypothetical protein VII97_14230 [Anaerolineales bacterium]